MNADEINDFTALLNEKVELAVEALSHNMPECSSYEVVSTKFLEPGVNVEILIVGGDIEDHLVPYCIIGEPVDYIKLYWKSISDASNAKKWFQQNNTTKGAL